MSDKPGDAAGAVQRDAPARWEQRSTNRVLESRRDQILERSRLFVQAAYHLLDEGGLEGLTIRAVLKRTGLSRRAFYERFADKDELMLAVFEHTMGLAVARFREQMAALPDPVARVHLIVTGLVLGKSAMDAADTEQTGRRSAALSREHLRLSEARPDDLQASIRPLLALIAEQLAAGMTAGLVRVYEPQRLAALVYNVVSTTVHTELLAQKSPERDRAHRLKLAADIWEFCRCGIAPSATVAIAGD